MTRLTRVVIGAVAGVVSFASCLRAQEVTIEQLVASALERAPEIRAARTTVAAASGQLIQAGLRPNPVATTSQREAAGGFYETMVGIEWPLNLFRRSSRVEVALEAAKAADLSVQDRERLLAAAIRGQAGRYLEARRTLEVMNEVLATAHRMHDLIEQRANEGEVPKLDANLAAVEVGRLEADQALATADADVAAIELKTLAGLDPSAPLALRDSLESLVRTPPPTQSTELPETALEARPDIREAMTRVALAGARLAQARREGRWDMTLSGSYSRTQFGFSQRGFDETGRLVPIDDVFHSLTVGAKIAVPLWHRNQGDVATAQAERNGAEEMLAARERSARAELLAALTRDREARRAVEVYASAVRGLARQNVDVLLQSYELGRTPLPDLLAGQRRYLEVEAAYTSVLSRACQAGVALRRARGEIR